MLECIWLRPEAVAEIQFLEWTGPDRLRHTKFIRLRDDKDARQVVRETYDGNPTKLFVVRHLFTYLQSLCPTIDTGRSKAQIRNM
jgi:hypothetical protein